MLPQGGGRRDALGKGSAVHWTPAAPPPSPCQALQLLGTGRLQAWLLVALVWLSFPGQSPPWSHPRRSLRAHAARRGLTHSQLPRGGGSKALACCARPGRRLCRAAVWVDHPPLGGKASPVPSCKMRPWGLGTPLPPLPFPPFLTPGGPVPCWMTPCTGRGAFCILQ